MAGGVVFKYILLTVFLFFCFRYIFACDVSIMSFSKRFENGWSTFVQKIRDSIVNPDSKLSIIEQIGIEGKEYNLKQIPPKWRGKWLSGIGYIDLNADIKSDSVRDSWFFGLGYVKGPFDAYFIFQDSKWFLVPCRCKQLKGREIILTLKEICKNTLGGIYALVEKGRKISVNRVEGGKVVAYINGEYLVLKWTEKNFKVDFIFVSSNDVM